MAEGRKHLKVFAKDYFAPRIEVLEKIIIEGLKTGEFETKSPILEVMNLGSFFMMYGMQRETYVGTPLYSKLYEKKSEKDIQDFIIYHFFKALSVDGMVKVPEVPEEILEQVLAPLQEQIKNAKSLEL